MTRCRMVLPLPLLLALLGCVDRTELVIRSPGPGHQLYSELDGHQWPRSLTRSPVYQRALRVPLHSLHLYSDVVRTRHYQDLWADSSSQGPSARWLWPQYGQSGGGGALATGASRRTARNHLDSQSVSASAPESSSELPIPASKSSQLEHLLDVADVARQLRSDKLEPEQRMARNNLSTRSALNVHRSHSHASPVQSAERYFTHERGESSRDESPRVPRGPGTFHDFVNTPLSPTDGSNCTFDPIERAVSTLHVGAELRTAGSVSTNARVQAQSTEATSVRPGREACPPCECRCTTHTKESEAF